MDDQGMGGNAVVQYPLVVVFAVLTLYYLCRLGAASGGVARTGHAARVAMGVAMVLMLRPWHVDVPTQLGVSVFLAAALWFGYLGLFRADADAGCHPWIDAAKMVAMAWMYLAMSPAAIRPDTDAAVMAMPDMPGMSSNTDTMAIPTWSICGSSLAAALLLVGALWLVRRAVLARGGPGTDQAMTAAMAAAMAVSLLLLV